MAPLTFEIPAAPAGYTAPKAGPSKLSAPKTRTLLPVGSAYLAHARRKIHGRTFDDDEAEAERERKLREEAANANVEDDLGVGDEEESPELLARDAKEWKGQDHYAVLGLSKFRYKATLDQIRIAHRKKVLKHHPDKKAGSGDADNDQFFKCIQKAFEILTNPERRRQFDSVDPWYQSLEDDTDLAEIQRKIAKDKSEDGAVFFKYFTPIFEREARFSRVQPVPMLGKVDAPKDEVEGFYDFWYNFDSWRSFEYLDKEVNEGSDSRDDKRYTEKKNKTERARRKKDDNTRLRSLVDLTLGLDPRIKRIKAEEKAARDAKKNKGKPSPAQQKAEEERLRKEAEEKAKKDAEQDAAAKAEAKKAKAAAANAAKKARRAERAATEGA